MFLNEKVFKVGLYLTIANKASNQFQRICLRLHYSGRGSVYGVTNEKRSRDGRRVPTKACPPVPAPLPRKPPGAPGAASAAPAPRRRGTPAVTAGAAAGRAEGRSEAHPRTGVAVVSEAPPPAGSRGRTGQRAGGPGHRTASARGFQLRLLLQHQLCSVQQNPRSAAAPLARAVLAVVTSYSCRQKNSIKETFSYQSLI